MKRRTQKKTYSPQWVIVTSAVWLILTGAALLRLPVSAGQGESISWLDAVFTATSAVCVTGLTVRDTGVDFSWFGQSVIMALMQLGGLGIMTVAVFFSLFLKMRISLPDKAAVAGTAVGVDRWGLRRALRSVVMFTALVELTGIAALFVLFLRNQPWKQALYDATFHSISAFCNAGFSLYSDSLLRFQHDPLVLSVLMALIMSGGLGFAVADDLRRWLRCRLRRQPYRLSLHARLSLLVSGMLWIGAALLFLATEQSAALAGLPAGSRILNACFLSVTARTAGFNSVPITALSPAGLMLLLLLMFIGGSSGSTAGGVKVGTVGVLCAYTLSRLRGRPNAVMFHRAISEASVGKALVTVLLAGALLWIGCVGAAATAGATAPQTRELVFETCSALGTVGLSLTNTAALPALTKTLLMVLMIVGRLGPLTVGIFLLTRRRSTRAVVFLEEDTLIG